MVWKNNYLNKIDFAATMKNKREGGDKNKDNQNKINDTQWNNSD